MSAVKPHHGTTHEAGAYPLATLPPRMCNSCSSAGLTTPLSSNHTSTSEHHSCTYTDSNPYATTDESRSPATPPLTAPNVTQRRCDFRSLPQWLLKAGLELKPCPFQVRLAFIKRPINAIKTVVSSFGKMTIVLSMVLATIYSIPAWRGLQLQAWTSRKDYYEYCQSEMVHLVGTALEDCNKAIEAGLSAPPGYTKRNVELSHAPLKLRTRQELAEEFSSTGRASVMTVPADILSGKVFILSILHIVLMWLFWFVIFMTIITQARKARSHLLAYRHHCCSSPRRLLVSLLPIASMIITAWAVIIMIEDVRWLKSKQLEADLAWQQYCNTLSGDKRPDGCISDGTPHHALINSTFKQAWYTGPAAVVVLACICALVMLSVVEHNADRSVRSLSSNSALPPGRYTTHRDVEGFDEVTNRPRTPGMSQGPTEIPLHSNHYIQDNLQLKDEVSSSADYKGKGRIIEARHPPSTVDGRTTTDQTNYSGASTFSMHAPSSQIFYDDEYLEIADFQSDDLRNKDFQNEAFLREDFRTENFWSDDFHSAPESRAADVDDEPNTGNTGEAIWREPSTNFRSSKYGEGETTRFFQGMDFDETSDLTHRRGARATFAYTGTYGANFPLTLSALPDLAADGKDLISSYHQSGTTAQPMVGTRIHGHEFGIDEVSLDGQFVPRPPFTGEAPAGQDRRWAPNDQPWNLLYPSGLQETMLSEGQTYAPLVPSSTAHTTTFTPSESGPSSRSYIAGIEASNTSASVYGQDMAESQATLRPQDHDPGLGSSNGPSFADTIRWDSLERSGAVIQAPAYSHVGTQMRGPTSRRSEQSGHTDRDVHISRQNSTASGRSRAQACPDDVEGLPCPHCDAIFRGAHQRGSLTRHMRMKHSTRREEGIVTYPCEAAGCTKTFMRMDARLKHYRKQHEHLNIPPAERRK